MIKTKIMQKRCIGSSEVDEMRIFIIQITFSLHAQVHASLELIKLLNSVNAD